MTDSAHLTLGAAAAEMIQGKGGSGERSASADQLWREHGWGLGSTAVAAVIALVLLASCAVQLLG